jgi:hypothetical protein
VFRVSEHSAGTPQVLGYGGPRGGHSLSHIIDPHHGAGDPFGWLEAGGLVVTTVVLAMALRATVVTERGGR